MIFRDSHTRNYTVMSNSFLYDKNLTVKAKCILAIILTYPDDWNFNYEHLRKITKLSKESLVKGVNELKAQGYIEIKRKHENGKICYEWFIYESQCTENQCTENQCTENQCTEKPTLLNTNIPITKELNTNNTKLFINKEEPEEDRLPWEEKKPSDEVFGKD